MAEKKPFTLKERRRLLQHSFGHRPTNHWQDGDLPAPFAAGDVVQIDQDRPSFDTEFLDRLDQGIRGRRYWTRHGRSEQGGRIIRPHYGYFVVGTVFSIDDGDAWYFRVTDGYDGSSDRLHVAYEGRCSSRWDDQWCDFMAPFSLVETADPDGLAERERLLAAGWTCPVAEGDPQP